MTPHDELNDLRTRKRHEATLRLTSLKIRVQWAPHWEIDLRATGRWWYMALVTAALFGSGVLLADCSWRFGSWIVDAEWSKVALFCGILAAISLTCCSVMASHVMKLRAVQQPDDIDVE